MRGTAFTYGVSESASVAVTVERKSVGRRSGGRCVKEAKRNRGGKRCSLFTRVGSFTQDGAAGANTKRWLGKVGSKRSRRAPSAVARVSPPAARGGRPGNGRSPGRRR